MKKITKLLIFSLIAVMLASCGSYSTPEKTVDSLIDDIQELNLTKAQKHATNPEMVSIAVDMKDKDLNAYMTNILSAFDFVDVEITSATDTDAIATLKVSQPDMGKLTLASLEYVISEEGFDANKFNDEDADEDEKDADRLSTQKKMYKFISDSITSKDYETIEAEYTLPVVKSGNKWLIDFNQNFLSEILTKTDLSLD